MDEVLFNRVSNLFNGVSMKALKFILSALALAFVLSSCASAPPEPETITDTNNCAENDKYKDGCN